MKNSKTEEKKIMPKKGEKIKKKKKKEKQKGKRKKEEEEHEERLEARLGKERMSKERENMARWVETQSLSTH